MDIMKILVSWGPLLLVLGGVVIFVRNYRKLARMTPAERARPQPEWIPALDDPSLPRSAGGVGIRHDDE